MDDMHKNDTQSTAVISENHQLQTASPLQGLSAEEADLSIDLSDLAFETTEELEPLDEVVGQSRAMSALEVGLGIHQKGYNIFAAGLTGSGKMQTIKRSLLKRLDGSTTPSDWVYVRLARCP
jgi:predicted ATPase with chaperone activity